jgi:hypothetical protein
MPAPAGICTSHGTPRRRKIPNLYADARDQDGASAKLGIAGFAPVFREVKPCKVQKKVNADNHLDGIIVTC